MSHDFFRPESNSKDEDGGGEKEGGEGELEGAHSQL